MTKFHNDNRFLGDKLVRREMAKNYSNRKRVNTVGVVSSRVGGVVSSREGVWSVLWKGVWSVHGLATSFGATVAGNL